MYLLVSCLKFPVSSSYLNLVSHCLFSNNISYFQISALYLSISVKGYLRLLVVV